MEVTNMKDDPLVEVSRADLQLARERWCIYYNVHIRHPSFANYLGTKWVNTFINSISGTIMLRKSTVDKIILLNSPHWYALLKARDAKQASLRSILKKSHTT